MDRWCGDCDGPIAGDGEVHDGEPVCRPCGLARRLQDARDALAGAEEELQAAALEVDDREEQYEADRLELQADRDADLAELGRTLADCERVEALARRRVLDLIAEGEAPAMPPISGGAPYEPTAEDVAEMHAWCESIDRAYPDDDGPEARYGYE